MKLIELTRGLFTQVDDEDYDFLMQWKWYAKGKEGNIYAVRGSYDPIKKNMGHKRMHHEIMGGRPEKGFFIDHKDRNGLNNQKENFRITTRSQNNANRKSWGKSKYKGVSFDPTIRGLKKWIGIVNKDKKVAFRKRFYTETEAAIYYNEKSKELHGEFANLNTIE